jgi:hypothetical protein
MGPLDVSLNGASTGTGFLVVSEAAQPLPGTLTLRTMDGSEGTVTLRPSAGSAGSLTVEPSMVHVSGEPASVQVLAGAASVAQNDASIEVVEEDTVVARLDLTALADPRVRFRGRFQCRLATNSDPYNEPWGTSSSGFLMYAVDGGNPLDPTQPPAEPALDRIIRFHDPVALRPLCEAVGVTVHSIEADLGGTRVQFTAGDPLLDLPVRLGPQCAFEEQDGDFADATLQPISNFRLEIGSDFVGATEPAVERKMAQASDPPPSKAPYADGAYSHDEIGPWRPTDFGYSDASWTERATAVVQRKLADLLDNEPPSGPAHRIWERRVATHQASPGRLGAAIPVIQRFTGYIDRELTFPAKPVGMLAYLRTLDEIPFYAEFFDFDTDCHTGLVAGTLGVLAPPTFVPELALDVGPLSLQEARGAPAAEHRTP